MRRSVITLGTFDGVHRGHGALLRRVVERARARKARAVVLAFGMPPRHVGVRGSKAVLLTTLAEKAAWMKSLGINTVHVLTFNRRTASTTPQAFFQEMIRKRYSAVEMVVGPRVAFGKNRSGRLPLLRRMGRANDVQIHVVGSVGRGVHAVSSRRIRALLEKGEVEAAARGLGYPYSIAGRVISGDQRGRRLGYPTANIATDPSKILPRGVFWVKVMKSADELPLSAAALNRAADGLCNVGTRPTFTPQARALHCEVFLLKGSPHLYGRRLRVVFLRKIRSEIRFRSGPALQARIRKDRQIAQRWMASPRRNFFTDKGPIRYNSIRKS